MIIIFFPTAAVFQISFKNFSNKKIFSHEDINAVTFFFLRGCDSFNFIPKEPWLM